MKFVSFHHAGRNSWGAVVGDAVVDLGVTHRTLRDFIASPAFPKQSEIASRGTMIPLAQVRYRPVIPEPDKIVLVVRNYFDHHQEVLAAGLQREMAEFPPIFLRHPGCQVAHGEPIIRPFVSEQLDWEGEIAVIIGKRGRHIPADDALRYVAGYSVYNDASIRDYQFHAKQITAGKNFHGTGAFGPWMVTPEEVGDPTNLRLETRVNGVTMQSSNTQHMIFKTPQLIAYASQIFELVPGDVIVTGTPAGIGWSRKPPVFMKAGDIVEVEIENIGVLRNPVVNENDLPGENAHE